MLAYCNAPSPFVDRFDSNCLGYPCFIGTVLISPFRHDSGRMGIAHGSRGAGSCLLAPPSSVPPPCPPIGSSDHGANNLPFAPSFLLHPISGNSAHSFTSFFDGLRKGGGRREVPTRVTR